MAKKLVSRTAKVLSETKKSKDKEGVAVAYEHVPRSPEELEYGSIYAVIEVEDQSGQGEEIVESIVDAFHQSYYEDLAKEPLEAFESSLAKINEALTDRSSEGRISWLGKLNAVLAVLSKGTLHVTQTGKAEAYLYRGDHSMHITDDLGGDSINPRRTFVNIASGGLSENDKIVLTTPGVFYKMSKSELKKFTKDHSPKIAAENISKMIGGENGSTKPNAVLLVEMVSPEAYAANDEELEEKSEVWVSEKRNRAEEGSEKAAGFLVSFFGSLGKSYASTKTFFKERFVPGLKGGVTKLKDKTTDLGEKKKENIILDSEEKISAPKKKEDENPPESQTKSNREIRIKEGEKKPKMISVEKFNFSFLENFKKNLSDRLKKISPPKFKGNLLYIGAAALGLVLLLGYFGYAFTVGKEKDELEGKIAQAETLYEESLTEISDGRFREASLRLESAEGLALEVKGSRHFQEEARKLLGMIDDKKDEANQITRNTASLFYDFESPVTQIFLGENIIYGVDFESGSVFSVDPLAATGAKVVDSPDLGGKITSATLVQSRNTLVAYTEKNEIYEIDLGNGQVDKQTTAGGWEEAVDIDFFGTNIYLLSPKNSQIYRHFKISGGYGAKGDYFDTTQDLTGTVGLAIDGDIYLTDNEAEISKYTRGLREEFSVSGLPKDYTDIQGIYTSTGTENLYLFSKNLVVRLDGNGAFIAQYANDDVEEIGNVLEDGNGRLFLVSQGKIYTISD